MAKKMTFKKFEGSKADEREDKRAGFKEGSKKELAADRRAVAKMNKKRGGK